MAKGEAQNKSISPLAVVLLDLMIIIGSFLNINTHKGFQYGLAACNGQNKDNVFGNRRKKQVHKAKKNGRPDAGAPIAC